MGVGGLVATMVLFVLRAEYPDWARRVSRLLARWAAYAFPEPERSVRREEWDAELAEVWAETGRACTGLTFASGIAARYGPRGSMRLAGMLAKPVGAKALAHVRRLSGSSGYRLAAALTAILALAGVGAVVTSDPNETFVPGLMTLASALVGAAAVWARTAGVRAERIMWLELARVKMSVGVDLNRVDLVLRADDQVLGVMECKTIRSRRRSWWRRRRAH